MTANRKSAKLKRSSIPKGNPAQNPRKTKRAGNVYRQRAKPATSDLAERFETSSSVRVKQIAELPVKGQRVRRDKAGPGTDRPDIIRLVQKETATNPAGRFNSFGILLNLKRELTGCSAFLLRSC
jgi:hypothetical protein